MTRSTPARTVALRAAATLVAVALALAGSASTVLAGGRTTGMTAALTVNSTGATCGGTLAISYNIKGHPVNEFRYQAIAGVPTPYGGDYVVTKASSRLSTTVPFTFASGTSVQYRATAYINGATYVFADSNVASCP